MFQEDILEIYNSLVIFNDAIMKTPNPKPITVRLEKETNFLIFETTGISVRILNTVYLCLGLEDLEKETYLLPEDYDNLMASLQYLIKSGYLLNEKTLVSPENYGFDVYAVFPKEYLKGLQFVAGVRFISGNSWWFKLKTKLRYGL